MLQASRPFQTSVLLNPGIPKSDVNEVWGMQLQKWQYQCAYLDKWRVMEQEMGRETDAIIAPISPTGAIRHDQFKYYGYALIFNLLNYTSVVVPVTFANQDTDRKIMDHQSAFEQNGC